MPGTCRPMRSRRRLRPRRRCAQIRGRSNRAQLRGLAMAGEKASKETANGDSTPDAAFVTHPTPVPQELFELRKKVKTRQQVRDEHHRLCIAQPPCRQLRMSPLALFLSCPLSHRRAPAILSGEAPPLHAHEAPHRPAADASDAARRLSTPESRTQGLHGGRRATDRPRAGATTHSVMTAQET